MKKFITIILALAMVLTMSVPAFADDTTADESAPAQLTSAQVKAIKPAAKAASYSYTKIKVSWDKVEGVDGYKVYRAASKSSKYSLVYTTTNPDKLYYINTGRTTGKTYYYKVRAYKKIGKTTYYTKYSSIVSAYARPNKAKISSIVIPYYEKGTAKLVTETYGSTKVSRYVWSVSSANNYKGFRVTWGKVTGATGYQLYMREKGKTTWNSKGYYTGTSAKVTFDDEKEYEFKVRAYRTVNNKKIYGLCSTVKSYEFKWDKEDLIQAAKKVIEESGNEYNDLCVDSEQGYDIIEPATRENCGWSGAYHFNYYQSLAYIEAFFLYSDLMTVIHDHDTGAYCIYISDVATEYGEHQKPSERGREIPLCYEVYFLSNGCAYHGK